MSDSPQDVHKKALGSKGEHSAVKYLKKQGYKILERNYRTPFGEADIIAEDGDEVVFTEVKTRESYAFGTPAEAVIAAKQFRYQRIAQFYWLETGREPNARFDVIEVYGDGRIEHYKYAF